MIEHHRLLLTALYLKTTNITIIQNIVEPLWLIIGRHMILIYLILVKIIFLPTTLATYITVTLLSRIENK